MPRLLCPLSFSHPLTLFIQDFHTLSGAAASLHRPRERARLLAALLPAARALDRALGRPHPFDLPRCLAQLRQVTPASDPLLAWCARQRPDHDPALLRWLTRQPAATLDWDAVHACEQRSSALSSPHRTLRLVRLLISLGRLDQARTHLATLSGPGREEALGRLAVALGRADQPREASLVLASIRHASVRRQARFHLARHHAERADLLGAALLLDPLSRGERARAEAMIAASLQDLGHSREASALLRGPAGARPEAAVTLAQMALDQNDPEAAAVALEALHVVPRRHDDDEFSWDAPGLSLADRHALCRLRLAELQGGAPALAEAWRRCPPISRQRLHERPAAWRWMLQRLDPAHHPALLAMAHTPWPRRVHLETLVALPLTARAIALADSCPDLLCHDAPSPPVAERGLLAGLLGEQGTWDARRREASGAPLVELTLERAAYDEGVARGPSGARRRAPLLRACRRVLQAWAQDDRVPTEVALLRLRCLAALGGEGAADIVESTARSLTPGRASLGPYLLEVLAELAPRRAARFFFDHLALATADGARLDDGLVLLEAHQAASPGCLRAIRHLHTRLDLRHDTATARLAALLPSLACAGEPPADLLDALAARLVPRAPREPAEVLAEIHELRGRLRSLSPARLLERLVRWPDEVGLLRTMTPDDAPEPGAPPSPGWWRGALERLHRQVGEVMPAMVHRWAPRLTPRGGEALASALLAGRPPVDAPREVVLTPGLTLRMLDKRRDLRAYLRLADGVNCCWNSSYRWYHGLPQHHVLSLWKDPLSFGLLVVQQGSRGREAVGFVAGSFGVSADQGGALLQGLYLRRPSPALRFALLAAIEQHLARPLGLAWLALASQHGGRGPLPEEYRLQERTVRRLRALRLPDVAPDHFDDVRLPYNTEATSRHLFWKDLAPTR